MVVWLKRIVSYITVFIAIGYLVYTTIKAPVDLYQYMILLLLILISTTFILDNMDEDQKWRNIENDLKNIVSEISPTQIRFFDNSSDWVVLGNVLAFSLYMSGVPLIGPQKASLYSFAEPVTAAIISTLVLGSPFTLWDALGFGCIFLMLVLLSLPAKQKN